MWMPERGGEEAGRVQVNGSHACYSSYQLLRISAEYGDCPQTLLITFSVMTSPTQGQEVLDLRDEVQELRALLGELQLTGDASGPLSAVSKRVVKTEDEAAGFRTAVAIARARRCGLLGDVVLGLASEVNDCSSGNARTCNANACAFE